MLIRWCAVVVVIGAALAGCGSPSLPEASECPELRAFESSVDQDKAYQISVSRQLEEILSLDTAFRERWTERRIRELESFRTEFATYAQLTICHTQFMLDLEVPAETASDFAAKAEGFGTRMLAAMDEGRDAVASRNSSAYRDWVRTIDALTAEGAVFLDDILGRSPS